jgi:transposase-like protein
MPALRKYDQETRDRAVRMYQDRRRDVPGESGLEARKRVGELLDVKPDTLRGWIERVEVDAGQRPGVPSSVEARLKELQRENASGRPARRDGGRPGHRRGNMGPARGRGRHRRRAHRPRPRSTRDRGFDRQSAPRWLPAPPRSTTPVSEPSRGHPSALRTMTTLDDHFAPPSANHRSPINHGSPLFSPT